MAIERGTAETAVAPPIAEPSAALRPSQATVFGLKRAAFLALLLLATLVFLAPFAWLVSASLKRRSEVFNRAWIPDPFQPQNYVELLNQQPLFVSWLGNSAIVGILAALTVTVSSAFVAFGFAYFRFPLRNALFGLVLATMMLPGAVTMIPTFLIWKGLGQVNTLTPLWAGNLFASAFYIFLLRQFFLSLPRELFEAARVDGAGYLQMFRSIAVPLTRPALIVVFIFELKASWTDLVKPLIYLQNNQLFTLPRGLKALVDAFGTQGGEGKWELLMAASVLVTIPVIVIFFLGQRYFIEGIATTGSKG